MIEGQPDSGSTAIPPVAQAVDADSHHRYSGRLFRKYLLLILSLMTIALAGGFEYPGNGTEAVGRGTAFVAKADDA